VTGERGTISSAQGQSELPAASSLDKEQFMSYVRRIADPLPVPCKITMLPAGYTIADRVREIALEEAQRM